MVKRCNRRHICYHAPCIVAGMQKAQMKKNTDELKHRILDTAVALFIEKGIAGVTTRDVTGQLGLSRSHIYHYFSNWQALSLAALERFMAQEIAQFTREAEELAPEQQLLRLAEIYLPDSVDATWKLYDSLWQMAANNEVWAALAEKNIASWSALIGGMIQQGVEQQRFHTADAARVTRQLSAMLNGYAEVLSITPSAEKHRQAMMDITAFIRLALQPASGGQR